jgi:hypothetical protein
MPLGPICCNQWQFGKQNFEDLFYADDVVLFLCLTRNDLELCNLLSEVFGHVTGLKTNLAKSSVIPIQCAEDDLRIIEETTDCAIKDFPSTYLGLPLTIRKPAKAELHPLIDKVADSLPGWKASLMTRVGRLTMVRTVFTAIPIYQMIALDLPKWVIRLLISEEGDSCGKVRRRPMEVIVLCHGNVYKSRFSMEVLAYIIMKSWAGRFTLDGFGSKILMLPGPGKGCQ